MLVCVAHTAQSHPAFHAHGRFCINILHTDHEQLAKRFASSSGGPEKFENVGYRPGILGLPVLKEALAELECTVVHAYPGGDHTIFVGQVEAADARGEVGFEPLLYYRGRFNRLHRGGTRLMSVPLSRPPVDDEIKSAVLAAIDSRQYILGPECRAFEEEFARYIGTRHAVLTSSATAALWMALKAFGVKSTDEVLVPSHTAFPTIEAICFAGAVPVFVDVDDSYTVDLEDAAAKVTPRTVGFVPVHLYGHPADLDGIQKLCSTLGIWLLEDCAQAHGAAWKDGKVGSFGRAGAFSFYPSKNLTVMGDGGLLVTDDDEVAARSRRLRDHGRINKDVHAEIGFNLRFNDIQAAIGRVLLRRLDAMNDRRRDIADRYARGLRGLPLILARRAAGRAPRLSPLRGPHSRARRPREVPEGARHRHGHPLPGALPQAARRGAPRPAAAASAPSGS